MGAGAEVAPGPASRPRPRSSSTTFCSTCRWGRQEEQGHAAHVVYSRAAVTAHVVYSRAAVTAHVVYSRAAVLTSGCGNAAAAAAVAAAVAVAAVLTSGRGNAAAVAVVAVAAVAVAAVFTSGCVAMQSSVQLMLCAVDSKPAVQKMATWDLSWA